MRSLGLLGLVAGVLVATALVSPWVAWALAALGYRFTFARVYDRVFEVLLLAGIVAAWRGLDLGGAREIGFRRPGWGRDLGRGIGAGLAGLAVALAVTWALGALVPDLRYPPAKTVRKALLGLAGALAIGVGEEAVFRGVVLRRLRLDFGGAFAVVATTALYAALHLIRARGGDGPVEAWSGVAQTLRLFAPLASATAAPELIGLLLLGALLVAARLRSGALWASIGLHAAFVAVFRVGRLFFAIQPAPAWLVGSGWPPLVGGAAGWLAVGVAAAILFGRRARA